MFDLSITLDDKEVGVLAESIKDMIVANLDFYDHSEIEKYPDLALELHVLSKIYNLLPKKEKDSDATNDTVQFQNY